MKVSEYHEEDFLKRYAKLPILNPYVAYPKIMEITGDVRGKRIMDLGCGSGALSALLAEKGAYVEGVDVSREWIEICKKEYGKTKNPNFTVSDGTELDAFDSENFDYVVMNMVLLNVPSSEKVKKIFSEVARVLKKGGKMIFSDLHPICLAVKRTSTEEQRYGDDFSYFHDGAEYHSKVMLSDGSLIEFSDIHWTLESYSKWISDAGMCIKRIAEPEPVDGSPFPLDDYPLPEYIIFVCEKP